MIKLIFSLLITLLLQTTAAAETVLVTGANKGIGLAFVELYLKRGWSVIATARKPEQAQALQQLATQHPQQLLIEKLDVSNHAAIDTLADKYQDTAIDVLLNNAGTTGTMEQEQFGQIDYDLLLWEMRVNALGPLKMAEAFLPQVKASKDKKIIAVSSSMGSINGAKGWMYGYRSSKAALNMLYKNLATELKNEGIAVGLLNPGQTRTDLMKEVPGELRSPATSAADMARNIDQLTLESSGNFYQYDGSVIPW